MKLIGIGHGFRGDDAAGIHAVRMLLARYPELDGEESSGEALSLLNAFAGVDHVVILDCIAAAPENREPVVFDGLEQVLPRPCASSTHHLGLAEAIELGRALGRLPARLTVFGIPGHCFGIGEEMSRQTRDALAQLDRTFQEFRDSDLNSPVCRVK